MLQPPRKSEFHEFPSAGCPSCFSHMEMLQGLLNSTPTAAQLKGATCVHYIFIFIVEIEMKACFAVQQAPGGPLCAKDMISNLRS